MPDLNTAGVYTSLTANQIFHWRRGSAVRVYRMLGNHQYCYPSPSLTTVLSRHANQGLARRLNAREHLGQLDVVESPVLMEHCPEPLPDIRCRHEVPAVELISFCKTRPGSENLTTSHGAPGKKHGACRPVICTLGTIFSDGSSKLRCHNDDGLLPMTTKPLSQLGDTKVKLCQLASEARRRIVVGIPPAHFQHGTIWTVCLGH